MREYVPLLAILFPSSFLSSSSPSSPHPELNTTLIPYLFTACAPTLSIYPDFPQPCQETSQYLSMTPNMIIY
ncbi:hypothetical protein BDQ17DRAFT_363861 [Cyathus striatus]|nr:hypothetical protein BDQ17DRAFT_363861 [Cyathus striatus]